MRINLINSSFWNQDISGPLALIFLMVVSFAVAWYTVSIGQEVVDNAKNSPAFNIQKRIKKEMPDANKGASGVAPTVKLAQ
ncbi:MAG: hypothetical protein P4L62_02210 [Candidatus Pacebacteria bacterium]|nr:hypothetical protein [Candidatus Paceibacterota bacterium]MDR3583149.1 hypothetical protein [Candidatus Paceibacterota bacterium]